MERIVQDAWLGNEPTLSCWFASDPVMKFDCVLRWSMAITKHGTRVVQAAFEMSEVSEKQNLLDVLKGKVWRLALDLRTACAMQVTSIP